MRAGGDSNSALPAVGDDQAFALGGNAADPHRFREAADAADVGLQHVELTTVSKVKEFEAGVLPLTGGNANRRPIMKVCIAVQIINVDWRLDEKEVKSRESLEDAQRPYARPARRMRHRPSAQVRARPRDGTP